MFTAIAPWCARARRRPAPHVAGLLLRAVTLVLVLFHAGLLRAHFVSGQFLEPLETARWITAALILAAFLALRRRGLPVLRGRRAVVLWLLVVLLHLSASQPTASTIRDALALPATVATIAVPAGFTPLVVGLWLALLAALRRRRAVDSAAACLALAITPGHPATRAGWGLPLSSRPPPI